jgi:hypothetical protein
MRFAAVIGAAWLLGGCISVDVATDPGMYNLKPAAVAHLRVAQPVALLNGYAERVEERLQVHPSVTWVFDMQRLTDTAIAMLGRALEREGVKVDPKGDKSVVLRVYNVRGNTFAAPPYAHVNASVWIEATFGDGTTANVWATNRSPLTHQRAFDGAVLFGLNQLLVHEKFVDYMQR